MAIDEKLLKNIIEAALLVNTKPQSLKQLAALFEEEADPPKKQDIQEAINALSRDFEDRGIEVREVASGFRIQAKQELEPWISRLFQEKAPKYSRALLETLALIAYRQPITRSEIEQVRGVSVSTHIVKTLLEREWVRVVGHREVPGRPAMYATTPEFLDYFNIRGIEDLPSLAEIKSIDEIAGGEQGKQDDNASPQEALALENDGASVEKPSDEIILEQELVVEASAEKDREEDSESNSALHSLAYQELAEEDSAPAGEPLH